MIWDQIEANLVVSQTETELRNLLITNVKWKYEKKLSLVKRMDELYNNQYKAKL